MNSVLEEKDGAMMVLYRHYKDYRDAADKMRRAS